MSILTELCSIPTAPFAEARVIEHVERYVAARPKLALSRDGYGNLLIELRPRRPRSRLPARRLVLVAHMDHPGFVARRMRDARTLEADFRGGVLSEYLRRAKVRFFNPGGEEVRGTLQSTTPADDRPACPGKAMLRVEHPVEPGAPGMFDLGAARTAGGKFYSRVCDDLAGAASALATLEALLPSPPAVPVAALLTRAEEDGFIGALASVLHPGLLRKTDLILSIECSAMQPYARQGDGVILRVGDRTSIFSSPFMYFLHQQAELLAKRDRRFRYQRSLMPGGTCEATVFDLYGYTAGAACVPLGNYHNMDRPRKRIGPEYVDLADWNNMVKLFVAVARNAHRFSPDNQPLKERLEKRFRKRSKLL